jgi:hypothetical protein
MLKCHAFFLMKFHAFRKIFLLNDLQNLPQRFCFTSAVSDTGISRWDHPALSRPEIAAAVSVLSFSHVTQNRLYSQL